MSDNAFLAVVCSVAIAGCTTCHVSSERRNVEIERFKAEERKQLIDTTKQP